MYENIISMAETLKIQLSDISAIPIFELTPDLKEALTVLGQAADENA